MYDIWDQRYTQNITGYQISKIEIKSNFLFKNLSFNLQKCLNSFKKTQIDSKLSKLVENSLKLFKKVQI